MTTLPWLTVGVPTRDRPDELAALLSLLAAHAPELRERWRLQVLVADGSAVPAPLPDVLSTAVDAAEVLPLDGGVSAGRNVLADRARGLVLVLVDDDVRPHHGSLAALAAGTAAGTAVAGRVAGLGHEAGQPSGLMRLGRRGFGEPAVPGQPADYAVSALLALPRDVYATVRWDERFAAAHLDDVMYGLRLRAAGVRLRECPQATADHPARKAKDLPELAGHRALVVLTRWSGQRLASAWLRCLGHVAWTHRRSRRDLAVALTGYARATWSWRVAR